MGKFIVALAGNPNCGKTTLFNVLTSSNARVGNWAGVTVEKKTGFFKMEEDSVEVVDLPGTYALSSYTLEEKIARDFIKEDEADVVVNVVDALFLERSMYLSLEILEMGKKTVLAVNMMDELEKQGKSIDLEVISDELGVPVVPISALKRTGIAELMDVVRGVAKGEVVSEPKGFNFSQSDDNHSQLRYDVIEEIMSKAASDEKLGFDERSSRIDSVLLHPFLGVPIFFGIMYSMFYLTYSVGGIFSGYLDDFFGGALSDFVRNTLEGLQVSGHLVSLVVDGIIGGVGGILTFVPNIAILFIIITILEDSGYMARAALLTDKYMSRIGLNGRYFIPMVLGFGCNVPAIMSTKTLEDENDRMIAILTNPFISCSARFPVYVLFASVFFKGYEAPVTFSLYLLGIGIAVLVAFIFRKTTFKGERHPFIIELPPYRLPDLFSMAMHVWEKVRAYLIKAGTVIFAASVVIWLVLNIGPGGFTEMNSSYGAMFGRVIAPVFAFNGFDTWQAALSLFAGVSGKEIVVSNMLIVYGIGEAADPSALSGALSAAFTPISAYAFLVFVLLYTPCVAVIGTIKRETNSWKWTIFSVVYQLFVAWSVSLVIYQLLSLIF